MVGFLLVLRSIEAPPTRALQLNAYSFEIQSNPPTRQHIATTRNDKGHLQPMEPWWTPFGVNGPCMSSAQKPFDFGLYEDDSELIRFI